MKKLEAVLNGIDNLSEKIGKLVGWFIVIIAVITLYEIMMKHVFASPTRWVFETSIMLWGACFVTLAAWTQKAGEHIVVDVIYARFPPRIRVVLDLFFYLALCLMWVSAVVMGGIDFAIDSWEILERTITPWGPPIYPLKTILPVGFALLGLQCLAKVVRDLITLAKGEK